MDHFEKGLIHTILGEYAFMLKKKLEQYCGNNSMTDDIKMKLEYVDMATEIINKTPLTESKNVVTLIE